MAPYLILHKVRGEPTFDIAEQLLVEGEDEPWWVIPTSGHRAWPYWSTLLKEFGPLPELGVTIEPMPPNHPDHYASNDRPLRQDPKAGATLLASLGLTRPVPKIERKI